MKSAFSKVLSPLEGLTKLLINTYFKDGDSKASNSYVVMYNPQSYDEEYKIYFDKPKTNGTKEVPKFKYINAKSLTIELMFDATGASLSEGAKIQSGALDLSKKVKKEKSTYNTIRDFLADLSTIDSKTHKPKFAEVVWGDLSFTGVLETSKVTHNLFGSDGRPIRSKVSCTFKEFQSLKEQAAQAKTSSPDVTKFKQVLDQDNLPLISYDAYEDPGFYLELARVNRINNFRGLTNGTKLRLPPVNKR